MALEITITDAGRAAIVDAENTGTAPVTISEVGVGDGSYTSAPEATATALKNEIKRLTTIAGEIVADDTLHVTVKDEGNDVYDVTEFGLYLNDGTLFAIYAVTSGNIMQKAASAALMLSADVALTTVDATSLTFGDTSFTNPPASETVKGVVELATNAETQTGTDVARAVTPAGLSARSATESRTGLAEVATQTETDEGADDSRIVTPKKLDGWKKEASVSALGLIKLSTDIEAQGLSHTRRAITPATLESALQGANQSLSANGYQRLPGGLIIQWLDAPINSPYETYNLPISFPNAWLTGAIGDLGSGLNDLTFDKGISSVTVYQNSGSKTRFNLIAIGY